MLNNDPVRLVFTVLFSSLLEILEMGEGISVIQLLVFCLQDIPLRCKFCVHVGVCSFGRGQNSGRSVHADCLN